MHDHTQFGSLEAPVGLILVDDSRPERKPKSDLEEGMREFDAVLVAVKENKLDKTKVETAFGRLFAQMKEDSQQIYLQKAMSSLSDANLIEPTPIKPPLSAVAYLTEEEEAFYNRIDNLTRYLSLPAFRVPVHVGVSDASYVRHFISLVNTSPKARICPMAFRFVLVGGGRSWEGNFVMLVICHDDQEALDYPSTSRGLVVAYSLKSLQREVAQVGFTVVYRKIMSLPLNTHFRVKTDLLRSTYFTPE